MKNWMKVERAKREMTQDDLAEAIGVSRYSVMAIESQRYEPSCEFAMKVSRYFGLKVEDVFFLSEKDVPKVTNPHKSKGRKE